ncbi:MAG: hypothetical protein KatS3mg118_1126 [Paracoccaceae bacterium]|nr:MAG: hypothetical protein KatS3mg118_1126 [Paracoccaceae bacterium]
MFRQTLAGAVAASMVALGSGPAAAQERDRTLELLGNMVRAQLVLMLRGAVEFTYESLSYDLHSGATATGVRIYPRLDWLGQDERCEIVIGRLALNGETLADSMSQVIEVTEVTVPPVCLEEEMRGTLGQLGYEGLAIDTAVLRLDYQLSSAAARLTLQAAMRDAVTLNASADFAYFGVEGLFEDDPRPTVLMSGAELSLTDAGLWSRVEPMVGGMVGSVDAIPDMVAGGVMQELTRGGQREISPAGQAFVDSLGAALGQFVAGKGRLTVRAAPQEPVWLNADVFDSPDALVEALAPVVSTEPHSAMRVLAPELLRAALSEADGLSEAERLAAGRALMSGIGAPRNRDAAMKLLVPLAAGSWNAEAAMILAEGLAAAGRMDAAYPYALVALAGGMPGAGALAARIEGALDAADMLKAQSVILAAFPEDPDLAARRAEVIANATVEGLRKLAFDAYLGRSVPRSYPTAYLFATLAAAAGDQASANLRDDLDRMAAGRPELAAAFAEMAAEAERIWAEDGLGAAIHARIAGQ